MRHIINVFINLFTRCLFWNPFYNSSKEYEHFRLQPRKKQLIYIAKQGIYLLAGIVSLGITGLLMILVIEKFQELSLNMLTITIIILIFLISFIFLLDRFRKLDEEYFKINYTPRPISKSYIITFIYISVISIFYLITRTTPMPTLLFSYENGEEKMFITVEPLSLNEYVWIYVLLFSSALILSLYFYLKIRNKETLFMLIMSTIILVYVVISEFKVLLI